jgi:protein-tyrosine phosphatase
MDWDNRALLEERCPFEHQNKIKGFAEFLKTTRATVLRDPYFEGEEGLEYVLDLIEEASEGLIEVVSKRVSQ